MRRHDARATPPHILMSEPRVFVEVVVHGVRELTNTERLLGRYRFVTSGWLRFSSRRSE